MSPKTVYGLVGPTASGKTAVSLRLAGLLGGEILCMDSMQVYRGCDIGTAKSTPEERSRVPHHLIDLCGPGDCFTVTDYRERCEPLLRRVSVPILTGGTGLYLDSLMYEQTYGGVKANEELRAEYHRYADAHGSRALHALLLERDPAAAARLHPNDVRRVVRALEVLDGTGRSITEESCREPRRDLRFVLYAIDWPRETLYSRIDARVDLMMAQGLEREVRALWDSGVPEDAQAIQGLGYKELYAYFSGRMTLPEAVRLIKVRTRHYAKRQLTWFRRVEQVRWLKADAPEALSMRILDGSRP